MILSILVPACNEVHTILGVLEQLKDLPLDKEIIFVDDFSTDGTRELLKERLGDGRKGIKVVYHEKNMGKGSAVRTALRHAAGDYSVIQDADLEYNPQDHILLFQKAKNEGVDAVYGSRFMQTWRVTSFWHFMVNKFLTVLANMLFGAELTDMETCYKMVRTDILKSLNIESRRFEIEVEITAKLLRAGYKIIEVPISYQGRSYHEGKKITWRDGFFTLWTLLVYRIRRL